MIKCRIWDEEDEKMYMVAQLNFNPNGEFMSVSVLKKNLCIERQADQVILMQSSGISDKNGNEIFEGDYIRASSGALQKVLFGPMKINDSFSVGFSCFSEGTYWLFGENDEIVGNIYEDENLEVQFK